MPSDLRRPRPQAARRLRSTSRWSSRCMTPREGSAGSVGHGRHHHGDETKLPFGADHCPYGFGRGGDADAAPIGEREDDERTRGPLFRPGVDDVEGVFVVEDGQVRFVPVEIGITGQEHFEVLTGVKQGTRSWPVPTSGFVTSTTETVCGSRMTAMGRPANGTHGSERRFYAVRRGNSVGPPADLD